MFRVPLIHKGYETFYVPDLLLVDKSGFKAVIEIKPEGVTDEELEKTLAASTKIRKQLGPLYVFEGSISYDPKPNFKVYEIVDSIKLGPFFFGRCINCDAFHFAAIHLACDICGCDDTVSDTHPSFSQTGGGPFPHEYIKLDRPYPFPTPTLPMVAWKSFWHSFRHSEDKQGNDRY